MKNLKQVLTFIKNLFIKKEEIVKEKKKQEISIQKFNDINPGDIIRAKRYSKEYPKELIPEGHQEGPFIVVKNLGNKLLCSQGTGVIPKEKYIDFNFCLDNIGYNLCKKTYFHLNKLDIIDNLSFIEKIDELYEKDKNKFFEQVKIIHKNKYMLNHKEINLDLPYQVGDIIINNNNSYLIIDINNNKLKCVQTGKIGNKINFEDFKYLDYSKTLQLHNIANIKFINRLSDKILLYVLKKYKEYVNTCENQKITQRGSIILKEEKYYYIYSEEGQDWITFEISKTNIPKLYQLKINDTIFCTNFNDVKINKKEKFDTISLCTLEEIDIIKNLRKQYKLKQKKKEELESTKYLRLNVGDIIESKYYKNQRFIIISVCPKTYECLSIEKIKKGIYDPILIRKQDTIISKNTSIEGIKWLEWNPNFKIQKIGQKQNIDKMFDAQKKYLEEISNSVEAISEEIANRGNVIIIDNKYYYIYGEEGNKWMIFEIYKNFISNFDQLEIDDDLFYTNYNDILINKGDNFSVIYACTEEEINQIKNKRKAYKKKNTLLEFKSSNISNNITVNSIIKCNEFSDELFKVVDKIGNVFVCVSYTDRALHNQVKHYINKERAVLVESKQKRK